MALAVFASSHSEDTRPPVPRAGRKATDRLQSRERQQRSVTGLLSSALGVLRSLHSWPFLPRPGPFTRILMLGPLDKGQTCCCFHSGNFKAREERFRLFVLTGDSEKDGVTSVRDADLGGIQNRNVLIPLCSGGKTGRWNREDTAVLPDHISFTPCGQHLVEVGKGLKCQEFNTTQPMLSYLVYLCDGTLLRVVPHYLPRHALCLWRWWLENCIKLKITYVSKNRGMVECGGADRIFWKLYFSKRYERY